ncbi:AAA family ATPase [Sphingomonas abietis]|uniref:ATP-binding protein n=1 Tax=Sphingomonas abietis TaxID=3012344 RepID=A0ABY7NPA5_9SPHN|nr:ATP-binding protein [Sphingomonas abietis]WBO23366.1 ATP-binding protein [Sphingomonas abietis]
MEHFSAIQSLCRIGLENGDGRFRKQVERLRDRLTKAGDERDAATLSALLANVTSDVSLAPSNVEVSRSLVVGDELTGNVHPPVDRETSVPLAEILLAPSAGQPSPIFDETLQLAMGALVSEWQNAEALKALGVEPSRSCLFYGPPGTGKTLAALTLAAKLNLPVVNARIDGLVSSFLGTTARNIANLFDFANRYRCVLILDEFDALAKMRDDPHELGELKRVVNTLLQNLDARANKGLTIAITNHEGLLDPAVWRRFQNHVRIGQPDLPTRLEMLRTFLGSLELGDDVIKTLSYVAGPRSGSDLKTFADALRRSLALSGSEATPRAITLATKTLLPRLGIEDSDMGPARLFLVNEPKFIGEVLHADLGIRQDSLAQMFDCSQSKISRWSGEWASDEKTAVRTADA